MEEGKGLSFFTGLYSSRPELKRKIKSALTLNRAANIISGLACDDHYNDPDVSLLIHQNAITGTCTSSAMEAYDQIMEIATAEALDHISQSIDTLISYGG
jgi:hypothetical protein